MLNTNSSDCSGATLYVTMFPCNECAKLMIQAGIARVIYYEARRQLTLARSWRKRNAAYCSWRWRHCPCLLLLQDASADHTLLPPQHKSVPERTATMLPLCTSMACYRLAMRKQTGCSVVQQMLPAWLPRPLC